MRIEPVMIGLNATVTLARGQYLVKEGSTIRYKATYEDDFVIENTAIAQPSGKFIMQVFTDAGNGHGKIKYLYIKAIIREDSYDTIYTSNLTIQPNLYNVEVYEGG